MKTAETTTADRLAASASVPESRSHRLAVSRLAQFLATKFRLRFSERRILLTIGDLLCANFALLLYLAIRYSDAPDRLDTARVVSSFVLINVLWSIANQFIEGTRLSDAASFSASQWAAGRTVLLASILLLAVPWITPVPRHRYQLIILPSVAIYAVSLWRYAFLRLFAVHSLYQRVLVIGAGIAGHSLIREIRDVYGPGERPGFLGGHWVVGFVDDDPQVATSQVEGIAVLGTHADLLSLVRLHEIDELILAITKPETIALPMFQAICDCREQGITVTALHGFYEQITGRVPVTLAGHNLYMVMPLESAQAPRFFTLTKRLVDLAIGLIGTAFMLCLIPWVWLANRLTSPGPLFYTQQRVGHKGSVFGVVKFRSMIIDAEAKTNGAVWAAQHDPRVTPIGRFLRRTRLDEFPQFWNVLCGQMSLIGPRPERPEFVEQLALRIPFYRMRHGVKPGITGWAQVRYPYGASEQDALAKLQYDLYYIKHQSVFLEWRITLKTLVVMMGLQGR